MSTVTAAGNSDIGNEIDDVTFFAGLTAAAPTEDPSTSFARYDSVENFSVLFIGTGLGDYDVDGFPTSGTITEFLIYDITPGTPPIFTLNATWAGMTSDAAMFHDWVAGAPGGTDDFRAAVFGSADTLTGSQYSDFLSGYDGDDVIISGGSDSDEGETLDGGADDDTIVVSGAYAGSSTINGSNNTDTIVIGGGTLSNGVLVTDVSGASLTSFEAVTFDAGGHSNFKFAFDQINDIGHAVTGSTVTGDLAHNDNLTFVVNVAGAYDLAPLTEPIAGGGNEFSFVDWTAGDLVSLAASDFLSTNAYELSGNTMANGLTGASGNDVLNGDAGNDVLFGGISGTDSVNGQEGDDVIISLNNTGDALDGGDDAETDGDTLVALGTNALMNSGSVSGFENLTLARTNGGSETALTATFASSQIGGGGMSDTLHVDGTTLTFDTVYIAMNGTLLDVSGWTFGENWTLTIDEVRIDSTTGDDDITGSTGRDDIGGGLGNDIMRGGDGNDIFYGNVSDGTDTMIGGQGDDRYGVFDATDIITEASSQGDDFAAVWIDSYTMAANLERATLFGTNANITGNALGNIIIGNASNNTLDGGTGSDSLVGGDGNDTYVVDVSGDITTESSSTGGTDTVQSYVTRSLGANIENLTLTGTSAINATGNALGNLLTGNTGANTLDGLGGVDTMIGGDGSDTYVVDVTGDITTESSSTGGTDTVQSYVTWTLGNNLESLTLKGSSAINATGNALANTIVGNSGSNVIAGGLGNDILTGGSGADFFVFNTTASASNRDSISDFNIADDTIHLENSVFTAIGAAGALASAAFHIGAAAHDTSDRIIYNSATGALLYDADGNGAGASVQIATLDTALVLTSGDFGVI